MPTQTPSNEPPAAGDLVVLFNSRRVAVALETLHPDGEGWTGRVAFTLRGQPIAERSLVRSKTAHCPVCHATVYPDDGAWLDIFLYNGTFWGRDDGPMGNVRPHRCDLGLAQIPVRIPIPIPVQIPVPGTQTNDDWTIEEVR